MKKNKMMRIASVLLVAVLLSTCAISGTFAKYVTSATATDSARVAKWGVKVEATSDAFKTAYNSDTDDYAAQTVISTVDVVAPGTNGTLTDVTITGTPEVAVRVTYDADLKLEGWKLADGTEYCPVVFTVEGVDYAVGGSIATVADLEAAVESAIANCKKDYAANTAITATTDAPSVSWSWAFETTGNDANDTYLGDQAAAGNAATIELSIVTTATQID